MSEEGRTKPRQGDSWKPVDLAARLASGYEPPTPSIGEVPDSGGLFYAGRINQVFGDSGGGKTWFLVWVAAEEIEKGNDVLFIDFEDQPEATVSRLEQVGIEREAIIEHLIYIQPHERWSPLAKQNLEEALAGKTVTVGVIDSTGESMAIDGVASNSDDDVAKWFRGAPRTLSDLGIAVVLLDHVPKTQAHGRNTDFSIGSQRKRAAINGASYYLDVISAPSREEDGKFKLVCRKDRFGFRKHGSVACVVEMNNKDNGDIEFVVAKPVSTGTGGYKYSWYMEAISKCLEESDEPLGMNEIERRIGKSSSYVGKAAADLVAAGYASVDAELGPRNSKMHRSVKPFRECPDEQANAADPSSFF